jgi:hypothetical protein
VDGNWDHYSVLFLFYLGHLGLLSALLDLRRSEAYLHISSSQVHASDSYSSLYPSALPYHAHGPHHDHVEVNDMFLPLVRIFSSYLLLYLSYLVLRGNIALLPYLYLDISMTW